jgi:hypothetical protein
MLNALIKAENDLNNIRDIVWVEQRGGKQFHISQGQANASVAETTIQRYGGEESTCSAYEAKRQPGKPECFGCGGPHPWSKMTDNKYVVICPHANEPGIWEKAELNIQKYQAQKKKNARNNQKRCNLNTVNWEDIPEKRREILAAQHHASLGKVIPSSASSASSTLTGGSSPSIIRRGTVTLHQDVVVLSTQSSKPQVPITIYCPMPHLSLQTGTSKEEKDCPALCCMFDTGASLNTAIFHYMEAVIRQYPHILKAIYLPDDYAAIILSGIVTSPMEAPITTKLSVGFELHLPYVTKDGDDTSLLIAAGPDVAVNLILGLPFIKATGIIADFIDNVFEAKHLICDPFPINFRRATKSVPVYGDPNVASHSIEFQEVLHALGSIKAYLAPSAGTSPLGIFEPPGSPTAIPVVHPKRVAFGFGHHWVPPSKPADDTNDYVHNVLGDMGYL